ncbi:MAG: LemA family protein [Pseudobacter sp.]|uniref:LemA family protein n=1 Tax=Pseudobacter sp. TaxID=2045420 RepID=UPI003F7D11D3
MIKVLSVILMTLILAPRPAVAQSVPAELKLEWMKLASDLNRRNKIVIAMAEELKKDRLDGKGKLKTMKANATSFRKFLHSLLYNKDVVIKSKKYSDKLTSSMGEVLVRVEKFPKIRARQKFQDLMKQLEGTENRIKASVHNYNEYCKNYDKADLVYPEVSQPSPNVKF